MGSALERLRAADTSAADKKTAAFVYSQQRKRAQYTASTTTGIRGGESTSQRVSRGVTQNFGNTGAAAETPKAKTTPMQRVSGTLSGAAKSYGASVVNTLGTTRIYSDKPIDWKQVAADAAYSALVGGAIGGLTGGVGGTNTSNRNSTAETQRESAETGKRPSVDKAIPTAYNEPINEKGTSARNTDPAAEQTEPTVWTVPRTSENNTATTGKVSETTAQHNVNDNSVSYETFAQGYRQKVNPRASDETIRTSYEGFQKETQTIQIGDRTVTRPQFRQVFRGLTDEQLNEFFDFVRGQSRDVRKIVYARKEGNSDEARRIASIVSRGESGTINSPRAVGALVYTGGTGRNGSGGSERNNGTVASEYGVGTANRGTQETNVLKGTGAVRGEVQKSGGEARSLDVSESEKLTPKKNWAVGNEVQPKPGSVAYDEVKRAKEFGVPVFIICDEVWDKNRNPGAAPAFSSEGQIYLRESLPENGRGTFVDHEMIHIMRGSGFEPYTQFLSQMPNKINRNSEFGQLLYNEARKHAAKNMVPSKNKSRNRMELEKRTYDEICAMVHADRVRGIHTNDEFMHEAFRDFDSYVETLESIFEQFKNEYRNKTVGL